MGRWGNKYTCYCIQLIHTYTDVIVVHAYSHYIFYIYTMYSCMLRYKSIMYMSMKTACEYSSEGDEKSLLQPQLSTNNSNTVYTRVQNV